jgi:hypothetical protein
LRPTTEVGIPERVTTEVGIPERVMYITIHLVAYIVDDRDPLQGTGKSPA